jgi:hypothetical protein
MNAKGILATTLALVILAVLAFHQWQLGQAIRQLQDAAKPVTTDPMGTEQAAAKLGQAEAAFHDARTQLQIAEQKLAAANARLAQIEQRSQQKEIGGLTRPATRLGFSGRDFVPTEIDPNAAPPKRGWGPEQAAGEPDTMQAGDISTAWAPREQDGGEEWLKLDYEISVEIAEVRVRETYNPGAISKVTAFLANGSEVTLWEGVEPKATAPVEMSFTIPDSVNAKSVKVYLDTRRVPGWNEIDAVQIIGRDGSQQWAKQAMASSTYAEPRVANRTLRLTEFE